MRTPEIPGKPRSVVIGVRVTPEGAEELDRLRGGKSRAGYIRDLIAAESRSQGMRVPSFLRRRSVQP